MATSDAARQERIAALGWRPPEELTVYTQCPCCEDDSGEEYQGIDRYGFRVTVAVCHRRGCGHRWLSRYTDKAQTRAFYADGHYRTLVDAYTGEPSTDDKLRRVQLLYAQKLTEVLAPHVAPSGRLLDVGGAPGTVADALCRELVLHIPPSIADPASARDSGWPPLGPQRFACVVICQTIDHVVSPDDLLGDVHRALRVGGVLWVDIVDYLQRPVLKWDHPQMFTDKSIHLLLDRVGFGVVQRKTRGQQRRDSDIVDVKGYGYVCRRRP